MVASVARVGRAASVARVVGVGGLGGSDLRVDQNRSRQKQALTMSEIVAGFYKAIQMVVLAKVVMIKAIPNKAA